VCKHGNADGTSMIVNEILRYHRSLLTSDNQFYHSASTALLAVRMEHSYLPLRSDLCKSLPISVPDHCSCILTKGKCDRVVFSVTPISRLTEPIFEVTQQVLTTCVLVSNMK
jgi:hypothetical protein